jgi:hypothetical protein
MEEPGLRERWLRVSRIHGGLEDGLDAFAAIAGHRLAVEDRGLNRPADVAQPREPRKRDQLAARPAEGVNRAVFLDLNGTLVLPIKADKSPACAISAELS